MNLIRLTIVALVGAGSLHGESPRRGDDGQRPGGPRDGGRDFKGFFESADSNGDGVVSAQEFASIERLSKLPAEKRDEIFRRFDKNGDGLIQRAEMRPPPRPDGGGRHFPKLEELDSNKDGRVSFEEFVAGPISQHMPKERLREFFNRLDTNGDGSLSPEDLPKDRKFYHDRSRDGRPPGHDPSRMIELLDKSGDKSLSFAEFSQAPWLKDKSEDEQEDLFEKLDKNSDLKIEQAELPSEGPKGPPEGGGPRGPKGSGPNGPNPDGPRGPQKKGGN